MKTLLNWAVTAVLVLAVAAFITANIYTAVTCDGELVRGVLTPTWKCIQ